MFISQNFSIMPIRLLYKITNGNVLFSLIMALAQMTLPFYVSYYTIKKMDNIKEKHILKNENVRV